MRVAPRAPAGSRGARWQPDRRANMQVVEVMIVGLLVVSAVVAVSTMNVPVTETEGFKQDNERLVKDSLAAMAARPSQTTLFGSTLEEYVMEAIAGQPALLMDYLNKTLPGGASYNVYLDNHYGPPRSIVKQGEAPREAVAGSVQMVPKLSYTFTVPEFEAYHGDFHMNLYAVPIQSGVLLHDEGESVEVTVVYQEVNDAGKLTDEPIRLKTYTHTAWRNNDAGARQWPSVAISAWNPATEQHEYMVDRNSLQLYGDRISNNPPTPMSGDAYNITWWMNFTETAGVKVPKNTLLTIDIPRGYDFNASKQAWLADQNKAYWKDWTFTGTVSSGWIVQVKTKETFKAETIDLLLSSNFRTAFDTAWPFYTPLTFTLGQGVLGEAHILIDVPQQIVVGAFGREAYVSVTKPLISGDKTTWGLAFANNGDRVKILNVTVRQPADKPMFAAISHENGWAKGEWKEYGSSKSHYYWDPNEESMVETAKQMWLTFGVTAGTVTDNNFRNQDYLRVEPHFNPENGTGVPNTLAEWTHDERLYRMGEEWIYRDTIPPYDGAPPVDHVPGWADQEHRRYWVTGGTYGFNKELVANTSYAVLPTGIGANAFGGYQGAHVASTVDIVDKKGQPIRDFALGDNVHIRNDFSALFGELSRLQSNGVIDVNDLEIRTKVYTPELGWKGMPSKVFEEDASLAAQFTSVERLLSAELSNDGVPDLVAIASDGMVYGIDGRDGAKMWTIDTSNNIASSALRDLDGNGRPELLLGLDHGNLAAYDTDPSKSLPNRKIWDINLTPLSPFGLGVYTVTDIVETDFSKSGQPDTVVAVSAVTGEANVVGLDTTISGATKVKTYDASALTDVGLVFIYDLVQVMWSEEGPPKPHLAYASAKETVTMLTLPDLEHVWTEKLPQTVDKLHAVDLDGDGNEDLVADTLPTDPAAADGQYVFTLNGESGDFAPTIRTPNPEGLGTIRDAASAASSLFAVDGTTEVLVTRNADYDKGATSVSSFTPSIGDDGFYGVHAAADGTVFLVSNGGSIYYNSKWLDDLDVWHWTELSGQIQALIFRDLHVSPTLGAGGPVLVIDEDGGIWKSTTGTTGSYAKIAQPCTSALVPHANIDCGVNFEMRDVVIEEDADGEAAQVWVLAYDGGIAYVARYDVGLGTWKLEADWAFEARALHLDPIGGVWIAGGAVFEPQLWEKPADGTWRSHTLWRNETFDLVEAVLVQEDGTAWAASQDGQIWKRSADRLWVPFYVDGHTASTRLQLVETIDGEPWLITEGYGHVPLRLFDRSSYIELTLDGFKDDAKLGLRVDSLEGHAGGSAVREAPTQVQWVARPAGATSWQPLFVGATASEPGIYNITHEMMIECRVVPSGCNKIELRAYLNNTQSPGTTPPFTMGGVTPTLRSFVVNVSTLSGEYNLKSVVVDESTIGASSTAVYSEFRQGAIQATARTPWTYYGQEESQVVGAQKRLVAVSPTDLRTGEDRAHVVVVNDADTMERWVLNGTNGLPDVPSDLSSFGLQSSDRVERMILAPLVGDSATDVVMGGRFDGDPGTLLTWDVSAGTDHVEATSSKGDVTALVDSGVQDGLQTVTMGDDDGLLNSMSGSLDGTQVSLRWTNAPGTAQGKATFVYAVPMDAMYGTAIVVSELTFEMTEGGIPVTQTARMVDWFDMRPRDREVPRPPIYTIQIVSWFNEA